MSEGVLSENSSIYFNTLHRSFKVTHVELGENSSNMFVQNPFQPLMKPDCSPVAHSI